MSDFKAKMHQIRFRLGLRPHWGSLQRSPDPLARFKGPTSEGMEERERERRGGKWMGREGRGGEGREEVGAPFDFFASGRHRLSYATVLH